MIDQYNYSGRGNPKFGGPTAVFGGQVIGQALTAAFNSIRDVDSTFQLHSIHCYFVNPTLYEHDIFYKVERIKEGKSFCSLTVVASQGDGRVTFKCMVSFDKPEPPASNVFDFTVRHMPIVPHPDNPSAAVDSDRRCLISFEKFFYDAYVFPGLEIYQCLTTKELEDYRARRPLEPK